MIALSTSAFVTGAVPGLVALPLLIAGLLTVIRLPRQVRTWVLGGVLAVALALASVLLSMTASGRVLSVRIGGWDSIAAIPLTVDAFSAIMLVLTAGVALVVVPFAARTGAAGEPYFAPLVLLLMAGVFGALMTGDLFNLFVFIEVMLLPSYALLILAHRGQGLRMQVSATRIYVSVNLLTSSILLIGIAILYSSLGGISFQALLGRGAETPTARLGAALVLFALCVKSAVVPMHGWLARTYPNMSPTVAALFSGLHTKVAVYAVFRMHSILFGGSSELTTVGTVIFCVSMVVGVLAAIGETDSRAILSLHMVSQIGYILLGLAIHTPAAIAAGIFYLVHNVVAKSSLFLSAGAIETAYGRHPLGAISGLLRRERLTAVAFFAAAMSLAGLPPMSGFVAKLALIGAAFSAHAWIAGGVALGVSLFTLMSMLKIWGYAFLGTPNDQLMGHDDEDPRIGITLIGPALFLALVSLALGVGGQWLLQVAHVAADQLLHPAAYLMGAPR